MKDSIKHAFALGEKEVFSPNEKQILIVDKVCREVVKRHLAMPAILLLETFRPLNYIGSQVMYFFQPIISSVLSVDGYTDFTELLEQRGSVDYICERIKYIEVEGQKSSIVDP